MKPILLSIILFFSAIAMGQVPGQINYQGVARNAVGNVLPGKNITVRLNIRDGNPSDSDRRQEGEISPYELRRDRQR